MNAHVLSNPPVYAVGAMSGTSLDGVDVALLQLQPGAPPRLVHALHQPYTEAMRQAVLAVCQGQAVTLAAVGALDVKVARAYAQAVQALLQQAGVQPQQVQVLGAHGQTVHHQPAGDERFSMQLGDPNTLAVSTGIPVVADFRRRDMALGGQGAPLAPGFHDQVLRHPTRTRVVLNAGGIANISVLVPGQPCLGYDTGPANLLMDAWVQQHQGLPFDAEGAWAAQGQVVPALLQQLLADPYFSRPPPKSTGRELFSARWLQQHLRVVQGVPRQSQRLGDSPASPMAAVDVMRTLLELTALSVARGVAPYAAWRVSPHVETQTERPERSQPDPAGGPAAGGDLLVCGGGARNRFLLQRLAALLPGWHVAPTDAFGVPAQWMEAMAFAWFAHCTQAGVPASVPSVTGAQRPCVLGAVYRPW